MNTSISSKYQATYEGLYSTGKKIKGHKCALIEEVEPVAKFIKSGWFVPLRRRIKAYFSISEKNPMTKTHLKSTFKIKYENFRHLEKYYCMIHPFSNMRFHWEIVMLFTYNIQLNAVPILLISCDELTISPPEFYPFLLALNILCFLDIIMSFVSGYYTPTTQKIELKPKRVAKKYILTYFLFDLISVCQINYIAVYSGFFQAKWYYNIQWLCRFPRIKTFLKYSDTIAIRINFPRYIFKSVAYMNIWIIVFLWIMLLVVFLRRLSDKHDYDGTIRTNTVIVLEMIQNILHIRVPHLMRQAQPYYETLIYLGLLFGGLFLQMFITAQVMRIYTCRNFSKNKYSHLMNQIKAYTRYKQVPPQVNERIQSYVRFKFQKTVFKEKMILDTLSNNLKNEIIWHLCESFITKVDIFKDMPPNVMMKLVMLLKQEIYLPNDVVVHTGDTGTEMFFIYLGVLAVYTPTGREICHLTDGDHFGEIALLLNETRVASCIAVDYCELYRLTKKDFNEALEAYPAAKLRIIELGQDRFKETNALLRETTFLDEDTESQ